GEPSSFAGLPPPDLPRPPPGGAPRSPLRSRGSLAALVRADWARRAYPLARKRRDSPRLARAAASPLGLTSHARKKGTTIGNHPLRVVDSLTFAAPSIDVVDAA